MNWVVRGYIVLVAFVELLMLPFTLMVDWRIALMPPVLIFGVIAFTVAMDRAVQWVDSAN